MDSAVAERSFIRHVVMFSARDRRDLDRIVEGLSLLKKIPFADVFEVGRNMGVDGFSGEIDIVVYAEFADADALAAYKAHPLYQKSIELVRPLREIRVAADF